MFIIHDDVIKWKHFPRNWPFVRGIHRSPVNSPHKGQWRGALMLTLICTRINGWVNTREAGDLRRCRPHYYVIVMGEFCWKRCIVFEWIYSGFLETSGASYTNEDPLSCNVFMAWILNYIAIKSWIFKGCCTVRCGNGWLCISTKVWLW